MWEWDQSNKEITENECENSSQKKLSQENWAQENKLMLLNSQHAHNCRVEADISVFNMLTIVDWADSINQLNA